jgi:hypothetical protein
MRRKKALFLLSIALIAAFAFTMSGAAVAQAPTAHVYLDPVDQTIDMNATTTVDVWLQDVADFYGVEFTLGYDQAVVEALSVQESPLFGTYPDEYQVIEATVGGGQVNFALTLLRAPKAPPISGTFHLATIEFRGIGQGTSPLTWPEIKLSDSYGNPIPFTSAGGTISVAWMGQASGRAFMEGRSDHSGIAVDLVDGTIASTTTDTAGWYYFSSVVSDTYDITMGHSLYLTATLEDCTVVGGSNTMMPDVTLLGGDLNGDAVIDILDLSYAGSRFNSTDPTADINADGVVDIFDVVLIGKNFMLTGPRIYTCVP